MTLVVDASIAAAWLLPDERSPATDGILRNLYGSTASVPSLFWHEVRNLILVAERRGRLVAGEVHSCLGQLRRLPLADAGHGNDYAVLTLATAQTLSAYDAVYLERALSLQYPLATLDKRLAAAARREGVPLLGPLAP